MIFEVAAAALGMGGEKPEVPDFKPIDLSKEQSTAITANREALPGLIDMATQINSFWAKEAEKQAETTLPGYSNMRDKVTGRINEFLGGELPKDVAELLQRRGAEYGVKSGTMNSTFSKAKELRDLGLTSLDMISKGISAADRWIAQARSSTRQFDFSAMLQTPMQRVAVATGNEQQRWGVQWLKNQISAMPSPLENAIMSSSQKMDDTMWSALSTYAGGAMGGAKGA